MPSEREWREGRRLPSRKALNMDSLAMFRLDWKKIVIICLYGSYLCCFSWWACRNWGMGDEDYAWQLFPWIVTSLALNVFCLFGIKRTGYTDIGSWFLFASYLFMHGHIFLVCLRQETTLLWNPSLFFSWEELFHSAIYAHFCLCAFGFGYALRLPSSKHIRPSALKEEDGKPDFLMKKIGIILLLVGLIFNAFVSFQIVSATRAVSSYSGYSDVALTGGSGSLAMLILPGVIYLLCSHALSPRQRISLTVVICGYLLLVMLLSGSRKFQIFYLLTIALCFYWTNGNYRLSFWKMVLSGSCLLIFLDFLYIIREHRMNLPGVGAAFWSSLENMNFIHSIAGEVFAETGLTFYSVVSIVTFVPAVFPFEYGLTFVRTIPTLLPIGWLFPEFFGRAASTTVINTYTELPVGASLLGDFYWNFGFAGGMFAAFLWGWLLAKVTAAFLKRPNRAAMYFSMFFVVLLGVRAGIFELFRPFVMVFLLPMFIYCWKKRNERNQNLTNQIKEEFE